MVISSKACRSTPYMLCHKEILYMNQSQIQAEIMLIELDKRADREGKYYKVEKYA